MAYIFGGDTGKTQSDIDDQRKRLAYAMLQQGMDTGPVQSPWQSAARLAQALMGGLDIRQQNEERTGTAERPAAPTGTPPAPAGKSPGFLSSLFDGSKETEPRLVGNFTKDFPVPEGVPVDVWGAMTPGERKLWQK